MVDLVVNTKYYAAPMRKKYITVPLLFFILLVTLHLMGRDMTTPLFSPGTLRSYYFYSDTIDSFKHRKLLEHHYRLSVKNNSPADLENLTHHYHRDVLHQTVSRDLLPLPPPLFSPLCVRYLSYNPSLGSYKVSVVISYHDELPVLLFRTLAILIHRTSPSLLHEVVLVDDASSGDPLEKEILAFSAAHGVKIVYFRSSIKLGITRARRKGIELTSGNAVAILDSHMEVGYVWLEPLLDIISTRPGAVAAPCTKMISEANYPDAMNPQYPHTVTLLFGMGTLCFDTNLPPHLKDYTSHYQSPGLAGGALLARRDTLLRFYPVFSPASGWGVENSRLSIRAWLCGDGVFMSCCSQVVHPNGNDPQMTRYFDVDMNLYNSLLVESTAEIINFISDPVAREKCALKVTKDTDMLYKMSQEIRSKFDPEAQECQSFAEYVEQIHPHSMFDLSDSAHVGEIQSVKHPWLCVENFIKPDNSGIISYPCRKLLLIYDHQVMGINRNGAIRTTYNDCWTFSFSKVEIKRCLTNHGLEALTDKAQIFSFRDGHIKHLGSSQCLALKTGFIKGSEYPELIFTECESDSDLQKWQVKAARWL